MRPSGFPQAPPHRSIRFEAGLYEKTVLSQGGAPPAFDRIAARMEDLAPLRELGLRERGASSGE